MKTRKTGKIVAIAVLVVICALIVWKALSPKPFADAVALPLVSTETPENRDIELTTGVIGTIEPSEIVYVYPKAAGDITQVSVQAGDMVEQGQLLCTIDTKQVETARTNLESARLSLKQANEELSRQQILYEGGGISSQAYEQYRNSAESARIQYEQAKYNYDTQVEYSQIKASISGVVELCEMEQYDSVSSGDLLCVISGQGGQIVSFSATERISSYLHTGDSISVEKGGSIYTGIVYEISTLADSQTGLYKVKANISEENTLPSGSQAKVTITCNSVENAMTVPVDAVYYEDGNPYVYICLDDDTLRKQYIETGIMDSEYMEVVSGLSYADHVVTSWSSELYDGAQVRTDDGEVQE